LLTELNDTNGQAVVQLDFALVASQSQIAVDSSGNIWSGTGDDVCEERAYGGVGSIQPPTSCTTGGFVGGAPSLDSITNANGTAFDGAGTLWIGNAGSSTVPPNLTQLVPSQISEYHYAGFSSQSLAAGPVMVAVDGSGNVWVLLANNTITEYVGIATPAITPNSVAVKNKKIGNTP
jgi:hypothetical protein